MLTHLHTRQAGCRCTAGTVGGGRGHFFTMLGVTLNDPR